MTKAFLEAHPIGKIEIDDPQEEISPSQNNRENISWEPRKAVPSASIDQIIESQKEKVKTIGPEYIITLPETKSLPRANTDKYIPPNERKDYVPPKPISKIKEPEPVVESKPPQKVSFFGKNKQTSVKPAQPEFRKIINKSQSTPEISLANHGVRVTYATKPIEQPTPAESPKIVDWVPEPDPN